MHKIDGAGHVAGDFVPEDVDTNRPPTEITADWLNAIQAELCNVITFDATPLNKADNTQLRQAILRIVVAAQKTIAIDGVFAAGVTDGKIVRWNAGASNFALAIADGTTNDLGIGVADVTNGKVYLYGKVSLFAGLTPGVAYYLDPATPGAVTSTMPADGIKLGVAKDATTLILDIDPLGVRADQANNWMKGQAGTPRALPATTGTVTLDLSQANNWEATLTGNIVLANPSSMPPGTGFVIFLTNPGPYTIAYGSYFKPANGQSLDALTAVAGAKNVIVGQVRSATEIVVGVLGGY